MFCVLQQINWKHTWFYALSLPTAQTTAMSSLPYAVMLLPLVFQLYMKPVVHIFLFTSLFRVRFLVALFSAALCVHCNASLAMISVLHAIILQRIFKPVIYSFLFTDRTSSWAAFLRNSYSKNNIVINNKMSSTKNVSVWLRLLTPWPIKPFNNAHSHDECLWHILLKSLR